MESTDGTRFTNEGKESIYLLVRQKSHCMEQIITLRLSVSKDARKHAIHKDSDSESEEAC